MKILQTLFFVLMEFFNRTQAFRFMVDVAEFTPSYAQEGPHRHPVRLRCVGTVISSQHVRTTAECVNLDEPLKIVILIRADTSNLPNAGAVTETSTQTMSKTLNSSLRKAIFAGNSAAKRVFIHPRYLLGDGRFNLAVILVSKHNKKSFNLEFQKFLL